MIHLHEVHKLVNDLTQRKRYELAFQLCDLYRTVFEDGYLNHCYLTLPWRMGDLDKTVALMMEAVAENRWISTWFMRHFDLFADFMQEATFEVVLAQIEMAERAYWQSPQAEPITVVPKNLSSPSPLMIALHGNGLNAAHSAENWSSATTQGWLTTHPVATNINGYHQHWWNEMTDSTRTVQTHLETLHTHHDIDLERILLAGFSSGGQVALQMALEGSTGARGFLLVGAGGQHFSKPESYWRPLMVNAPAGLRGVMWYSAYDMERSGDDVNRLLRLFEEDGIVVRFVKMDLAGHGFPVDFDEQLTDAISFVLAED